MLTHTFCHIRGLGPATERRLWEDGILTWEDLADRPRLPLGPTMGERARAAAVESMERLDAGDAAYFYRCLPARHHWRLFPHFRLQAAYLDIETTGLGAPGDIITTIAMYDGERVQTFVHGDNLEAFAEEVARHRLLVTYNGKTFDLPFIRRCLGAPVDQAHVDLRYVLGGLGLRGGLKGCERQLGIQRGDLADVDGFFAVLLWREYVRSGDRRVLETLLAYNVLDAVNLETLTVLACNRLLAATPFAGAALPAPRPAANPFRADPRVIARLQGAGWGPPGALAG